MSFFETVTWSLGRRNKFREISARTFYDRSIEVGDSSLKKKRNIFDKNLVKEATVCVQFFTWKTFIFTETNLKQSSVSQLGKKLQKHFLNGRRCENQNIPLPTY